MIKKITLFASVLPVLLAAPVSAIPPAPPQVTIDTLFAPCTPERGLSWDDAMKANQAKNQFHICNPTPADQWRPFYTDQGGLTPITIDAGSFGVQFSPFSYAYNSITKGGLEMKTQRYGLGGTWVKAGVLNNLELDAGIVPYTIIKRTDKDAFAEDHPASSYGVSDFAIRARYNLWGNDGGNTALAAIATMKFPTESGGIVRRDRYEGGPGLAFSYYSPCGFDVRLNSLVTLFESDRGCWESCYYNSLSVEHRIYRAVSGYAGIVSEVSNRRNSDYDLAARVGVIYQLTENFNVYGEADPGIHGAPDYSFNLGLNYRFGRH